MYVVSKAVLDVIPPLTLVLLREVVGVATLGAIMAATRAPLVRRADLPLLLLLGFVGLFISMVAQFAGTRLSTAASGALITCATPAFMVLFAWPVLRERPTRRSFAGLALATAAVASTLLIAPPGGGVTAPRSSAELLAGNVLLVIAALTWALYSVLGHLASRRYPVLVTTAYATGIGALCTGLLVPFELAALPVGALTWPVWLGVLYLGVVSTAGAFYLWNKSIALLGAAVPSILFFAQPVVGGLLGALLLGEQLGPAFFLGGALLAAAVVLTATGAR